MVNRDTNLKQFENVHNLFLDGKYDTMNILVETDTFGAVSTDINSADGYYVYIYIYILLVHTKCK